jgi:hypothetical protein
MALHTLAQHCSEIYKEMRHPLVSGSSTELLMASLINEILVLDLQIAQISSIFDQFCKDMAKNRGGYRSDISVLSENMVSFISTRKTYYEQLRTTSSSLSYEQVDIIFSEFRNRYTSNTTTKVKAEILKEKLKKISS